MEIQSRNKIYSLISAEYLNGHQEDKGLVQKISTQLSQALNRKSMTNLKQGSSVYYQTGIATRTNSQIVNQHDSFLDTQLLNFKQL